MKEKKLPLLLQRINSRCEAKEVKKILDEGADINTIDEEGNNALDYAVIDSLGIYTDTILLLIRKGIDINHQNVLGNTPLSRAAHYQHNIIVKYLIENGSDINVVNKQGKKPIDFSHTEETTELLNIAELVDEFTQGEDLNKSYIKLLNDDWGQEVFLNRLQNISSNKGLSYDFNVQKYNDIISFKPREFFDKINEIVANYKTNENLNILEATLLHHFEGLPMVPASLLFKNQGVFSPEVEALKNFYNHNPQFKIPGNYLLNLINNNSQSFIEFITNPEGCIFLKQLSNINDDVTTRNDLKKAISNISHNWQNINLHENFFHKEEQAAENKYEVVAMGDSEE